MCLTHTESTELLLSCAQGHINILSLQYGVQEVTLDDKVTCDYIRNDDVMSECLEMATSITPKVSVDKSHI